MIGELAVPVQDLPISEDHDVALAWVGEARERAVANVLSAPVETGDGRSRWVWLRLANGDLFLACAPQGALYEDLEGESGAGWGDDGS